MKTFSLKKVAGVLVATVVAAPAFADTTSVAFTAPSLDFTAVSAWVGGALAAGVIGIAVSFKGIDLAKRGIKKA